MPRRKAKKATKQAVLSAMKNAEDAADPKELPKEDEFTDQEVERQSSAIRMIRDVEIERLLNALRLLRSIVTKEQLQTPLLQFVEENLPNLKVVRSENDGPCALKWNDKDGDLFMNTAEGGNLGTSFLKHMSMAYPDTSAVMPSVGGFEFSSKAVKTSLFGADDFHIKDFVLEEPSDTRTLGMQDSLQTPGVRSQRLSVGMTPKTLRLPKHGEMLLSVHGSPLGVYKEDNMDAIHETEEE